MQPIKALIGVTLHTPHMQAMADFYAGAFGLAISAVGPEETGLRGAAGTPRQLVLRRAEQQGLAGLTFAMGSAHDVDQSAAALRAAGVVILQSPGASADGHAFVAVDPDGLQLCFAAAAPTDPIPAKGDKPLYLSHVVINTPQPDRMLAFYRDVLGFTVSDAYEKGLLSFLRCDQPQHHCLGISPAKASGLNHFAMDCGGIDALMRGVGRMKAKGHSPVWGPGRHGPGGNIFCYFEDPDGFVPEFTCDVLQIEDPAAWQPQEWTRTPENGNTWLTGGPSPRAIELMSGQAPTYTRRPDR